jgi:methionyl-tRNA formyltransferase
LRRLSSRMDVSLVVTRAPRPAGRGSKLRRTDVALEAAGLGLELREVEAIGDEEGVELLRRSSPDAIAVVAYGEILPAEVLSLARCVNLHFSLLPRWRGAAPVQRAIMAGDTATGVTTILMDEGLDTGPLLMSGSIEIEPSDDAGSLGSRLAEEGADLLARTLLSLDDLEPQPQSGEPTSAPKLTPTDRIVDWTNPAVREARRVRALSPEPGASTNFRGRTLKIYAALVQPRDEDRRPGQVIETRGDRLIVACGEDALAISSLGSEGRTRMAAADWLRGARLDVGETLG